jgi:glyoxylase-like metal-dependent hydrolase (beta-lactamase superfamily II)
MDRKAAGGSALAALLLIVTAGANPAWAQSIPGMEATDTEDLGGGLYVFRWGPYRNIFLVGDEGVIATDPINNEVALLYRQAIAAVTGKAVKYVAYSHSHWDHVRGGAVFKQEGASFVAQEKCAGNLTASPNPDVVMPDITFADTYRIGVGAQSLELYHFGPVHDTCMSVMLARPANVLFIVDIVSPYAGRALPFNPMLPDFHLYNVVQYFKSIEVLAAREGITTFVGAHLVIGKGEDGRQTVFPAAGPVSAIRERREFWESVLAAVKEELDAGTVSLVAHNKIDLAQFADARGYTEKKMQTILKRVASYYTTGR